MFVTSMFKIFKNLLAHVQSLNAHKRCHHVVLHKQKKPSQMIQKKIGSKRQKTLITSHFFVGS